MKSPQRYTFPQLVAGVLMAFYLDKSYRDLEEWLLATERVCRALGLKRVPAVIKRKFGDTIRSRKRSHQRREPAVKGLVYDLHR